MQTVREHCERTIIVLCVFAAYTSAVVDQSAADGRDSRHPVFHEGKWGYIDGTGEMVVSPTFTSATNFFGHRAAVSTENERGYIDTAGNIVAKFPLHAVLGRFADGRAWVRVNQSVHCIDERGRMVSEIAYDGSMEFSEGFAAVMKKAAKAPGKSTELWGFVDRNGRTVIPIQYEDVGRFSNGLARVLSSPERGPDYVDRTGMVVLTTEEIARRLGGEIGMLTDFAEERLHLQLDRQGGQAPLSCFVDLSGKLISDRTFAMAYSFSEGRAAVKTQATEKYGFIDKSGDIVIPPRYEEVGHFKEGVCPVFIRDGDEWCYINPMGDIVLRGPAANGEHWNDAEEFHDGLARVHIGGKVRTTLKTRMWAGGAWHYIDQKGKVIRRCCRDEEVGRSVGRVAPR